MSVVQPSIDVRHLLRAYTVEQLNQTADEYFSQFRTPDQIGRLLAKPFLSPQLTPEILISFANVVQGLHLSPHQVVLDFGAGPCWATRYLTQMGLRVIACDVSSKALELGKKGFELYPIQGPHHKPRFLEFDSHRIDLPDESVDRIFCQDAFHHVPNQEEVLRELARILRPGGVAGFSEPGPNHSKSSVSQYEMSHFTVIENDIILEEIWPLAEKAGFSHLQVGYFTPLLTRLSQEDYVAHVYHGKALPPHCTNPINTMLRERRLFFLYKLDKDVILSGDVRGHQADLRIDPLPSTIPANAPTEVKVHVRNTGSAVWLVSHTMGAYGVGIRLPSRFLKREKRDIGRFPLPPIKKLGVMPGEEVTVSGMLPPLPPGRHQLLFDMVCEGLFWFSDGANKPVKVSLDVR